MQLSSRTEWDSLAGVISILYLFSLPNGIYRASFRERSWVTEASIWFLRQLTSVSTQSVRPKFGSESWWLAFEQLYFSWVSGCRNIRWGPMFSLFHAPLHKILLEHHTLEEGGGKDGGHSPSPFVWSCLEYFCEKRISSNLDSYLRAAGPLYQRLLQSNYCFYPRICENIGRWLQLLCFSQAQFSTHCIMRSARLLPLKQCAWGWFSLILWSYWDKRHVSGQEWGVDSLELHCGDGNGIRVG